MRTRGYRSLRANAFLACLISCACLAQSGLAADGDLDPTFGTNGKVVTGFDVPDVPDAIATAVALQPDGKIVAAGWLFDATANVDFMVTRYNPDGSLDTTFDSDGRVRTDFFGRSDIATALVVQPDGKILVTGTVEDDTSQFHFAVVRYLPNGMLDPTFDSDGKAIGGFYGFAEAMALQPDGKIVVAGSGFHGGSNGDITLSRYNPDGTPDGSFGTGGTVHTDFGGLLDVPAAVLLLPGGKLVVVGSTETNVTSSDIALVRYNADGSPDGTFGGAGRIAIDFGGGEVAMDAVLQPDGRIVVSASISNPSGSFSVLRFLPDGRLDTAFGTDGRAFTTFSGFDEAALAVAMQADGKIVAGGLALTSTLYDFALARFNPDGSPDATFGPSGAGVLTDFFGRNDQISAIRIQPDGRIVTAGTVINGTSRYFGLARYLSTPTSPTPPACSRPYGYWRSHSEEWPVASLVLGSESYSAAELVALLHAPTKGDASVLLARQLITAKLNLAAGAGSDELVAQVAAADALLVGFAGRLPYRVSPASDSARPMAKLAGRLASRNDGESNPGGCGRTQPPK